MSDLTERVLALLSGSGAEHRVLRHEPVLTSEQASQVRGTPLEEGAKALVCDADGRLLLAVVPANLKLDTKRFKQAYGIRDLKMASAEQVGALGAIPGGVPPFGSAMGLPTYADEALARRERLSFNAGSREVSVVLARAADYFRIEQPVVGSFSRE